MSAVDGRKPRAASSALVSSSPSGGCTNSDLACRRLSHRRASSRAVRTASGSALPAPTSGPYGTSPTVPSSGTLRTSTRAPPTSSPPSSTNTWTPRYPARPRRRAQPESWVTSDIGWDRTSSSQRAIRWGAGSAAIVTVSGPWTWTTVVMRSSAEEAVQRCAAPLGDVVGYGRVGEQAGHRAERRLDVLASPQWRTAGVQRADAALHGGPLALVGDQARLVEVGQAPVQCPEPLIDGPLHQRPVQGVGKPQGKGLGLRGAELVVDGVAPHQVDGTGHRPAVDQGQSRTDPVVRREGLPDAVEEVRRLGQQAVLVLAQPHVHPVVLLDAALAGVEHHPDTGAFRGGDVAPGLGLEAGEQSVTTPIQGRLVPRRLGGDREPGVVARR